MEKRKEEGKTTFLGKYRRKKLKKKIDKYQENVINTDPVIQGWRKDAEKTGPPSAKPDAKWHPPKQDLKTMLEEYKTQKTQGKTEGKIKRTR